ncbi:MAG: bifunctional diaminohydroxyphosphoribosylaminopyrimidine deaminase/5-amino-6-(5-phosphoribosylamino)uracil reductase RibD [Lachnospiraceae bacterium]|nr:bifunctional diaminohydroxyphosphoribosylaminopyrimidine deaminase/5-amino-6-(5-phosphoribosylamino)uracil reductase RibD [Lachnospiraceae bacterium]
MNSHRQYMMRAIALAKKGIGATNPNPLVGAVIVKDGRILNEDYHHRYGEFHAERNAILNCTEDMHNATIYVTLEPCCHQGKTPPCTDIIIESGISTVYIGSRDPNPLVAGKGARILREHGITVIEDFCREECDAINPVFFHFITNNTPYIALKYAMTLDGKLATYTGASQWITNEKARKHVHYLRHQYTAIMTGIGTVLSDNPTMNCRMEGGRNPIRIICDSHLRIPLGCNICQTADRYKTIVAYCEAESQKLQELATLGIECIRVPAKSGHIDLHELMNVLGSKKIDSILLEGGQMLNYAALDAGIVHYVYSYLGAKIFGGSSAFTPVGGQGVEAPDDAFLIKNAKVTSFDGDFLIEGHIERTT